MWFTGCIPSPSEVSVLVGKPILVEYVNSVHNAGCLLYTPRVSDHEP